jgi:hypothetical protein
MLQTRNQPPVILCGEPALLPTTQPEDQLQPARLAQFPRAASKKKRRASFKADAADLAGFGIEVELTL